MGSYPAVGLTTARKAREAAKLQKAAGTDPVFARKVEKLKATRINGDIFKAVALEWYGNTDRGGSNPQWWQRPHIQRCDKRIKPLCQSTASQPELTQMCGIAHTKKQEFDKIDINQMELVNMKSERDAVEGRVVRHG